MTYPRPIAPSFPIEFIQIPQQNFSVGRGGSLPTCIVIHVVEGSKQACINQFGNPTTQVSSHLLVGKDGSITQFVSTENTAYANGVVVNPVSELTLYRSNNPNAWTISIEHEGMDGDGLTPQQEASSIKIVSFLSEKWGIPLDRTHIIGHREIDANKVCPGVINIERIIEGARNTQG